jgi:hypothetical protein
MRLLTWISIGVLVVGAVGCAGYRLGPSNGMAAGAKSIQVNPFQNKTPEPGLIEYVTAALRKSLQQDGTYRLNTDGTGDIVVTGVILAFNRYGVSYQPNDVLTVQDYYLSLTVQITARDVTTGKVVLDRQVYGRTTIRTGSDLDAAERQAIPMLAQDLARQATSLLADGSW